MTNSAAQAKAPSSQNLLGIGQVLARLRPEFPDLTPSKLRFLEERKLIRPARTESGYRKFSPKDLERLRLVLTMQRDQYLPLKVIRSFLADLDAGRNPEVPGSSTGPIPTILVSERKMKKEDLARAAGATPQLLADAISAALIAPAEFYGEQSLGVLKALAELQRSGIEPRHLRGLRAAVERDLSLIESALVPIARRNDPASRARVNELAKEIAGNLEVVRTNLIRGAISRLGG
ncbi:MAG: MerR family transcriptional regulator [Cryobacterium sp.]|nr:MerR family transcriptional regulator [Cryobacterium sp.]MBX3090687.1 MerR family transcriptional regulator [Cryobacterium sp.]MCO5294077.1 MerR family transcriptional regulator [Homoserinimonas sp.]MCW5944366.1 MerR family transcriptional regulator [Cryobacterium sp.]